MKGTLEMPRILGAENMLNLLTWVKASYATHNDMRSHTDGCMSFGIRVLMPKLSKQKLNTKSTTESEVVGASDYLSNVIWTELFLKHQGILLQTNKFYQDNQSVMKLEINGKR